jgi:hypothetical protein
MTSIEQQFLDAGCKRVGKDWNCTGVENPPDIDLGGDEEDEYEISWWEKYAFSQVKNWYLVAIAVVLLCICSCSSMLVLIRR